MFKKKTTVVIDHEAEEKAKQQAMQAELDALKPKPKVQAEAVRDNSVETNRFALNKIQKRTLKMIGGVVIICAVISLITWSILHKNYLDQQEKERKAKQEAERVAIEEVNNILNKKDFNYPECQVANDQERSNCENKKHYQNITQALQEHKDKLPLSKQNEVFLKQLAIIQLSPDQHDQLEQLTELAKTIEQSQANHEVYFYLSSGYRPLDKISALKYLRKAKELYANQKREDVTFDMDDYNFDENIRQLESELNLPQQ